ncbi:MAG: DinB family protein [Gemmatimonadetes bacterium]|nr:DinB family protein [Gemmatimonadota bacterium]
MIPERVDDLDGLLAEIERQHHEVADMFAAVSADTARWRPDETRWSMTGHVAHLGLVNEKYLDVMGRVVSEARAEGATPRRSDGPYRHPWVAKWFVRTMEPPVKRRMKTFRPMVPEPDTDPAETLATFQAHQEKLGDLVEASRGLDLGKIRFSSPFLAVMRFSLGTGFDMLLAHNRRHLWLIRELRERPDFPSDA